MAGNRGKGFEGGTDDVAGNIRKAGRGAYDLAQNLGKAKESWNMFSQGVNDTSKSLNDLNQRLSEVKKLSNENIGTEAWSAYRDQVIDTSKEIDKVNKKLVAMKGFDSLSKGFDKLGSSLLKVHKTIMSFGFSFLIDSIKDVYELQERWTKAIGEFNMKIGGISAGLKGATKAAGQWSSQLRGLTGGDIHEGIQLFGEFTMGMSRMVEAGDDFSKFGLQLARGFNLGGEAAGRFARTFENMNLTAGESAVVMSNLTDAANAVKVPVNLVAKDVAEASDYMARFGKEGVKAFVKGAAFARKFGMSIKDIQKSVEKFDGLEEATTTVAKFNVAFGTSINGIDMLLEDDPAARMEKLRQAMLSQGKTYENMSAKQVRLAAEMMGVNESQFASLMSAKNANFSYQKMMAETAKKEKSEVAAKALMQKALAKTAQTMFAFGAAWDRITTAIGQAIKPLLEVLGLAKTGEKDFKGFGSVMNSIFGTIEHFFKDLAGNKKWNDFMRELAVDMKAAGAALKDWVISGGAVKLVGKIVSVTKELYQWGKDAFAVMVDGAKKLQPYIEWIFEHSKEILGVWAGMKASNAIGGFAQKLAGDFATTTTEKGADGKMVTTSKAGRMSKIAGKAGGALGGAAMGAGIGVAMGGSGIGSGIGGAIGGMTPLGPIGAAIGAAVGGLIEKLGDWIVNGGNDVLAPSEKVKRELLREEKIGLSLDKEINILNAEASFLKQQEIKAYSEMAKLDEEKRFADAEAIRAAGNNRTEVNKLTIAQNEYWKSIGKLRDQATQQYEVEKARFAEKQDRAALEYEIEKKKLELEEAKETSKHYVGGTFDFSGKDELEKLDNATHILSNVELKRRDELRKQMKDEKEIFQKKVNAETVAQTELTALFNKEKVMRRDAMEAEMAFRNKEMFFKQNAEKFLEYQKNHASMSLEEQERKFVSQESILNPEKVKGAQRAFEIMDRGGIGFAGGGIVKSPTRALIGENGPEAVIPLRTMARGRANVPRKFGGNAAKSLVNYAAGGSAQTQQNQVQFVAGDVYLDGNKVGRHIVRSALSGRN